MKNVAIAIGLTLVAASAFAEHVNGYYRSNGTYVQGYERSSANNTVTDNYSYKGNTNPYTGSTGSNYYRHDQTSPYFNGTRDNQGNYGHDSSFNGRGN